MKIYVLEDETLILKHLLKILEELPYVQVVGYAATVEKAENEIPILQPNLILADIRLKDGDSFELFSKIKTEQFQIIFLTAYDEYAIQALNVGALAYLLKPVDEQALVAALDKQYHKAEQERYDAQQFELANKQYHSENGGTKRLALRSVEFIEIVSTEDIIFCKSDAGYTTFHLSNGKKILVSKGLKEYEQLLVSGGFIRCHQSYLVNVAYIIKYYKEGYLELKNHEKIPVSHRKKEEVMRYLDSIS